jgi:hypothetical protein
MGRPISSCVISLALAMLLSSPGSAARTTSDATALALITAPDASESRLLVKFDTPKLPDDCEISHAEIRFRIEGLTEMTELELYEVAGTWSEASVAWSDQWEKDGDFILGERLGYWMADRRTGDWVKFVVTESVGRFVTGLTANNGYVVLTTDQTTQERCLALPRTTPELIVYSRPKRR